MRVTDETVGARYEAVTGRPWQADARYPLLAATMVVARDVALRRAALSVRRVTRGRVVKVRALPPWATKVLDAETNVLAREPSLAIFTTAGMRALLRGDRAPEVSDPLPPGLLKAIQDVLKTTENAQSLAPRFFWEGAVVQAGAARHPTPTPAEIAMLAAAAGVESLGAGGLEPARRRWETRIMRWRRETTPPLGVVELRMGALPSMLGAAVAAAMEAQSRDLGDALRRLGENIAKAIRESPPSATSRDLADYAKYLADDTTGESSGDHPRTTSRPPTNDVAPRTDGVSGPRVDDLRGRGADARMQVATCIANLLLTLMGLPTLAPAT